MASDSASSSSLRSALMRSNATVGFASIASFVGTVVVIMDETALTGCDVEAPGGGEEFGLVHFLRAILHVPKPGPIERVADRRDAAFEDLTRAWAEVGPYRAVTDKQGAPGGCAWSSRRTDVDDVPLVLLAADALQNTRAALEYVAFRLFVASGGDHARGAHVGFPLCSTPHEWRGASKRMKVISPLRQIVDAVDCIIDDAGRAVEDRAARSRTLR